MPDLGAVLRSIIHKLGSKKYVILKTDSPEEARRLKISLSGGAKRRGYRLNVNTSREDVVIHRRMNR